jgi:hypothetical protein
VNDENARKLQAPEGTRVEFCMALRSRHELSILWPMFGLNAQTDVGS